MQIVHTIQTNGPFGKLQNYIEVVCVVKVRQVCSAVHKGRPCQPCKLSNQSTYFHSGKDASLLERFRLSELSLGSFQTSAYAGHVEMT